MIARRIDDRLVRVTSEDSDDLLMLRRIIQRGDAVTGDTTRELKREGEHSRPDKGERIKVRISLAVEKIQLDGVLGRLRIGGTISESSSEAIRHGAHHSLTPGIGDTILVSKRWTPAERRMLRSGGGRQGFVLVAIDTAECGMAKLRGTHLRFLPNAYSGAGGKRYKTNFDIRGFLEQARNGIMSVAERGDMVVIFGPGETKRRLANMMDAYMPFRVPVRIAEGIDSGGEDGIHVFTKSQAMKEIMAGSKLARTSRIIDEVMTLASRRSKRFSMGYDETLAANRIGAIQSMVFSDRAIQENGEQNMIDLLNDAEAGGAEVYSVDATTDIGLRVAGMGGVVSLLRYPSGT